MKPRERVRKALNHEEPDRAPIDLGGYQSGICWKAYRNLKYEIVNQNNSMDLNELPQTIDIYEINQGLAVVDEAIKEKLGIDTRYVFPQPPSSWELSLKYGNGKIWYTDWWGVEFIKTRSTEYFEPLGHPLAKAQISDLDKYEWPTPDESIVSKAAKRAKELSKNTDYAIFTTTPGLYEKAWYLTGLDRLLRAWATDLEFVKKILDKVLEVLITYYDIYLNKVGEYLDVVQFYDDLGGQDRPIFNPKLYRRILKPRHAELVRYIKSKSKVKVAHHCDGVLRPFLNDIIETGVDIINPVQVSASGNENTEALKQDYGEKISFWGAIDTQKVLPFGTTEQVQQEVLKRLSDLAPKGGYIVAPVHNIQNDVPPENILKMYEIGRNWRY